MFKNLEKLPNLQNIAQTCHTEEKAFLITGMGAFCWTKFLNIRDSYSAQFWILLMSKIKATEITVVTSRKFLIFDNLDLHNLNNSLNNLNFLGTKVKVENMP